MGWGRLYRWGRQRLLKEQENRRCLIVRMMGLLWLVVLRVGGLLRHDGVWNWVTLGDFFHEHVSYGWEDSDEESDAMMAVDDETSADLSRFSGLVRRYIIMETWSESSPLYNMLIFFLQMLLGLDVIGSLPDAQTVIHACQCFLPCFCFCFCFCFRLCFCSLISIFSFSVTITR